jgi:hypothetical protein
MCVHDRKKNKPTLVLSKEAKLPSTDCDANSCTELSQKEDRAALQCNTKSN